MESYKPESSTISEVKYDIEARDLIVVYKPEKPYMYSDVPVQVWHDLKQAESAGKFIAQNIKGKYEFKKIDE